MTDEELYLVYMSGKEEAAAELVERYGDRLVLFICGYIHDEQEAEDLIIDSFAGIFAKARPISVKNEGSFKAYLFKIGRNFALRYIGRRRLSLIGFDDIAFEPQSLESAEEDLLRDEKNTALYSSLAKLKKEYREALYLAYINGCNYSGAAKILGKSEKQITNLVYRGKQNLKTILEKEGFCFEDN